MKITKEYLETVEWLEHSPADEYRMRAVMNNPNYMEFHSKDGQFSICNVANMSNEAWHIHLDNKDFDTLASFDIETAEQANLVLSIYGKYFDHMFWFNTK